MPGSIWIYFQSDEQKRIIETIAKQLKLDCQGSGTCLIGGERDVSYSMGRYKSQTLVDQFDKINGIKIGFKCTEMTDRQLQNLTRCPYCREDIICNGSSCRDEKDNVEFICAYCDNSFEYKFTETD